MLFNVGRNPYLFVRGQRVEVGVGIVAKAPVYHFWGDSFVPSGVIKYRDPCVPFIVSLEYSRRML